MNSYKNWSKFLFATFIYAIIAVLLFGIIQAITGNISIELFGVIPFDIQSVLYIMAISVISVIVLNDFLKKNEIKKKKRRKNK